MSRRPALLALSLETPLKYLAGVGPVRASELAEAGFESVSDLLHHLPSRYEDRREVVPVASVHSPREVALCGRLVELTTVRTRRRGFSVVRGFLEDETGRLPVVWFNRPYLATQVKAQETYLLYGPVRPGKGGRPGEEGILELVSPSCEPAAAALAAGRVVAVYPQVGAVGPAAFRRLLARVFDPKRQLELGPDSLPAELRQLNHLPPLDAALAALHQPGEQADVTALNAHDTPAHHRLIYGELLELQLELAALRARHVDQPKLHAYRVDDAVRQAAREVLPFKLTGAQRRVLREIVDDLRAPQPMLRLLLGDVGSGKTIVAALALVVALESGLQGALMAPTELLAEQHFRSLARWLGSRYRMALLTSSAGRSAKALAASVASGETQLVVGTQSLIQEGIRFARLGLAVIDEQHRFGVLERQLLQEKGDRPDLLVMTATPIPRSLAHAVYGDLELSVIDELPPGRLPVVTEVVPAEERERVYDRLAEELASGAQGYVVFPRIEEGQSPEAASLETLGPWVRNRLGTVTSAVVHGGLAREEREGILASFLSGETRLLLATTVIEVGLDVPNATMMVIEGSERFGLAQLHQLRGRIGRGGRSSRCVALHGKLTEEGKHRLAAFEATSDGFEIAERDLVLRGPGDLLGTRQAGATGLAVADLLRDRTWLERARADAKSLWPRLGEAGLEALKARIEQRLARRIRGVGGG